MRTPPWLSPSLRLLLAGGGLVFLASGVLAQETPAPRSVGALQLAPEEDEEGNPIEREKYWRARLGGIPYQAIVDARRKADKLPEGTLPRRDGFKAVAPGGSPWVSFGPRPIAFGSTWYSGRVTTVAVDPVTPSTVYAGGARGGVWKSTDSGATWTPMAGETSLPTLAVDTIAVDPSNHNVVYAGTGEDNIGTPGQGLYKSTNAGGSWALVGTDTFAAGSRISRVLVGPTGTVFVASTQGLFFSTDGGVTWKRRKPASGFANGSVADVAMSQNGTMLLASVYSTGLFRSLDGGSSWSQLTSGLPASGSWGRSRIAIARSNSQVAYVIINPIAGNSFFTVNGGNTWAPMNTSIPNANTQSGYNIEVAVDPVNANLVYVGAVGLSANTNGTAGVSGGSWSNVSNEIHVDQHAIAFAPCTVSPCPYYVGNDGGVWRLVPQGGNPFSVAAENKNFHLVITEFIGGDLGINFVSDPRALGGSQDNGTELYVRDDAAKTNPNEWTFTLGADGGFAYLDHNNATPNFAYAEQQQNFGLYKSDFWGYSWFRFDSGLEGLPKAFYPFYTPDRLDNQHFAYAANSGVYEIIANQGNWYRSSQDLGGMPSALAFAPGSSAVLYAGLSGGRVYRTASAHVNGVQSTYLLRNTGLPAALFINSLAVDSASVDRVYLAGATFSGTPQAVYRTTDGGVNWTNITGNLPADLPALSIVTYYAGATRVLVVGTEFGVYFSTNEGTTWTGLNNGLPRTRVAQLAIDRDQTTLAAFTGGRGAFSTSIAGGTTCSFSISPSSASAAAAGGSGSVGVTAGAGCSWTAASNASFLTVTGGASGSGNGTVTYSVAANGSTSPRSGTLTIAGQTFTVNQAGSTPGCTYSISPSSASYGSGGGSGSVGVTAGAGCSWTAASNASFLTVTGGASGSGNGTASYSVAANSGSARSGTLTIAGQTFTVNQSAVASGCTVTAIDFTQISSPVEGGTWTDTFAVSPFGCAWTASTADFWISVFPGSGSGQSFGSVTITVSSNPTGFPRFGSINISGTIVQVGQDAN